MPNYARLQFVGPVVVFCVVLCAEAAAFGLSLLPTSAFLWRVNLEAFDVFQQSHYVFAATIGVPFSQFFIALAFFVMAIYGLQTGRELPLAIATNLTLIYTAVLIFIRISSRSHPLMASLVDVTVPTNPANCLPMILVAVSLVSAAISHSYYLRRIYTQP